MNGDLQTFNINGIFFSKTSDKGSNINLTISFNTNKIVEDEVNYPTIHDFWQGGTTWRSDNAPPIKNKVHLGGKRLEVEADKVMNRWGKQKSSIKVDGKFINNVEALKFF